MSSPRLFDAGITDFYVELGNTIDAYVNKNKYKWLKRTGVARAEALQKSVEKMHEENLSTTQFMWRLLSYAKMEFGTGPLDTSIELRLEILNLLEMCLKVNKDDIKASYTALYMTELKIMQRCAEMGYWYRIDAEALTAKAKALQIEMKLKNIPVFDPQPSNVLKDQLLAAIDKYKADVNAVWHKRLFKREGLERADKLKDLITKQLVGSELLDDNQLCARMLELASMPISSGQGIFGTSKELRNTVLMSMCEYLGIDKTVLAKEIAQDSMPVFVASSMGPVGRMPDVTMVSVDARIKHIRRALHENHEQQQRQVGLR